MRGPRSRLNTFSWHLNLHVLTVLDVQPSLLALSLLHAVHSSARLASKMEEGDSSGDRGPAGSGGTTLKNDSSDIKLGCRSIENVSNGYKQLMIMGHR